MTCTVPGRRHSKIDTADPVGTRALPADTLDRVTGAGVFATIDRSAPLAPSVGEA